MNISWSDVWLLYRTELRGALRESNIVLYSLLVPALLYPFMVWLTMSALSYVTGQEQHSVVRVYLQPIPSYHAELRSRLEKDARVQLVDSQDPNQDLLEARLDAVLEFRPGTDPNVPDQTTLVVFYDGSRARSSQAREHLARTFRAYRDSYMEQKAVDLGMQLGEFQGLWTQEHDHATAQEVGNFLLGILLPFTLIVILSIGGMYPAIDATAGERERNTWETSLTLATSRTNVILAKYLYVSTMAASAGFLNLVAMVISMRSIIAPLSNDLANSLKFTLSPGSLAVVALGTVLLALMMSAGMMILAAFARTFREGQAMVTPAFLLTLVPVAVVADSSLDFSRKLALVPVVNVALLWREAIHGTYSPELLVLTLVTQLICIAIALSVARWVLSYEDLMLGSYGGSFWKFLKERLGRSRPGKLES